MYVEDLMSKQVVTMKANHTVRQARLLLREHKLSAIPVVGEEGEARGIVSAVDLSADLDGETSVSEVMNEGVYVVPPSFELKVAAQVMRNQHIHRLVVVEDRKVIGVMSTFDLLAAVEDGRLVDREAS